MDRVSDRVVWGLFVLVMCFVGGGCNGKKERDNAGKAAGIVQFAAASTHGCALYEDGQARCWGWRKETDAPPDRFTQIDSGLGHICGIRVDGSVVCWGSNNYGQNAAPEGTFSQVRGATGSSCGLRVDQSLVCWGLVPVHPPVGESFTEFVMAGQYVCALSTDQSISCWGAGRPLVTRAGKFKHVGGVGRNACGVRLDDTLECWLESLEEPPSSIGLVTKIAGGYILGTDDGRHLCGIRTDQSLFCWGDSEFAQLPVPSGTFVDVSVSDDYGCAVTTQNELVCWGEHFGKSPLTEGM